MVIDSCHNGNDFNINCSYITRANFKALKNVHETMLFFNLQNAVCYAHKAIYEEILKYNSQEKR